MGKLYKIKRAVKQNPSRWMNSWGNVSGAKYVKPESWESRFYGSGWVPTSFPAPYKNLVASVLRKKTK